METNERSDRARVRTMAVTVKFKSAEIYITADVWPGVRSN